MSYLASALPVPNRVYDRDDFQQLSRDDPANAVVSVTKHVPRYGTRIEAEFVPRVDEDFADGGAYPEIHVAQFPLKMGQKKDETNALAVSLDSEGKINYDILMRQGRRKDDVVYTKYSDLLPKTFDTIEKLAKPTEDEVEDTTLKTKAALEALVKSKISAALPVKQAEKQGPAQFIRYTPSQQGSQFNSGASQRIIRMVEAQKDPMEPPKFRVNKKIPRGPPSPTAPVMHSPTRKTTAKEQQDWKIPPCISNWKNAKGFAIPLDKRISADGRSLQDASKVNDNFSKVAQALSIAERHARETVELRAKREKKLHAKEREKKENELKTLADEARKAKAALASSNTSKDEFAAAQEREAFRKERERERAKERNMARSGADKYAKADKERDITEQIALGVANPGARGIDAEFDQRLFNQSKGMDAGFGNDDAYNVYDKAWRSDKDVGQHIYRPNKSLDTDLYGGSLIKDSATTSTARFEADRPFEGAERSATRRPRDGPVAFAEDVDSFLRDVKATKRSATSNDSNDLTKRKR